MMAALLLEFMLVAGLLWVARVRLVELRGLMVCDPRELSSWPKRRGLDGVQQLAVDLRQKAQAKGSGGALADLALALAEPEAARREAGCNEALLDVEQRLRSVDRDGALLKLGVLGTLFAVALVVLGGGELGARLLGVLGLGGAGLIALQAMRREGGAAEASLREGIDAWVSQSLEAWGTSAKVDRRGRRR